jgi:hypothetical protein
MGGGGKSQTTTQQVSIPAEVLARYNAVNARAEDVASRGFQKYGTTAEDFVAPLTQSQQQGIQQTGQYAQAAQPYYDSATDQLNAAQQQGQAGLAAASPLMQQGIQAGQQLGQEAYGSYQALPGVFGSDYSGAKSLLQQGLGGAQGLLGGALGYTTAGAQAINPQQFSGQALNQYMSPFLGNVVQQTMAAQAQQNAQQRNALTGNAIRAGAFGGDRAGIAQANLAYQQNLANQQTLANLLQGGYGQALGAFQQQQGVNLAADQANRAALQQTGQALAGIGQQQFGMGATASQQQAALGQALAGLYGQQAQGLAGLGQQQFGQGLAASQQQAALAQQGYGMGAGTAQALAGLGQGRQAAGLQGAQAMLGAGQIQQQTEQAGKQALYNQFLQEQGYPFQVAQFLANIAMGTGALSGSTTTTQQPSSFFSDRKVKENVRKIGETEDGLPIYKFRYKGDKTEQTHIGYMADEVEKKHPDAVGEYGGVKTVDYNKVNARESMGGAVHEGGLGRGAYAYGGADHVDPNDLQALIAQQRQMYGPNMGGLYGGSAQQTPHGGKANVPTGGLHVGKLATAGAAPRQREGGLRGAMGTAQEAKQMVEGVIGKYNPQTKQHEGSLIDQIKSAGKSISNAVGGGEAAAKGADAASKALSAEDLDKASKALGLYAHGGLVPRHGYANSGAVTKGLYESENSIVPEEVLETDKDKPELMTAKGGTGGGGGGKSGASTALGIAGTLANFIPGVGPAIGTGLKAASMFFNEGGVVPRHGYQQGGPNTEDPNSVEATSNYLIGKESAGDPRARAATSSAAGLGQFTDSTARTVLQRNPEIVAQLEQQGITYDPKQKGFTAQLPESIQRQMVAAHVRQQQELLRQQGYEPTRENVRMNWFLGETGGPAFLNAMREDPNAPATAYADPAAIKANQSVFFTKDGAPRSVREVYSFLNQGGGGVGGGRAVASAQTGPSEGGESGGLGNFLTSSRFLVPLGTGLLTMASSPSRYLGAAALQGLGAGLAATGPSELLEERTKQAKLQNVGTAIDLGFQGMKVMDGKLWLQTKDGRTMEYGSWLDAGEPELVAGGMGAKMAHETAKSLYKQTPAGADIGAPKPPPVPKPQESVIGGQPSQPAAKPADGTFTIELPQTAVSAASAENARIRGMNQTERERQTEINRTIQAQALANRNAAFAMTDQLNNLASPLAGMAAGDQIAPGMFAPVLVTAANAFNYAVRQAGLGKEYEVAANAVDQYELAKKAEVALSAAKAGGLNMKAVSSLEELSQAIANPKMTAGSARDILATTILEKQKAAEEAVFTQKYASLGKQFPLGQDAATAFRQAYKDEMYAKEYAAIKDLLSRRAQDGTPLVGYLLKKGNLDKDLANKITPQLINKMYGFDISRYFLNTVK